MATAAKKVEEVQSKPVSTNPVSTKPVNSFSPKAASPVAVSPEVARAEAEKAKAEKNVYDLSNVKTSVKLPNVKDVLKAGVQFGHEAKRWHPNYAKFIFGQKNKIHIIDIAKSIPLMKVAGDFLSLAYSRGPILFLGTKRQASEIIKQAAIDTGSHYIEHRWAGGLLSNFHQIKQSVDRLNALETQFEEGVTGRTKYEISQMKKEWERLNRLYGGVKKMTELPRAVIVVDPSYEAGAIRECNYLGIPVVAIIDSNTNPDFIDYPIPANDDAINSIKLVVDYLTARLAEVTNTPFRVTHKFKDYTKVDVQIKKANQVEETKQESKLPTFAKEQVRPASAPVSNAKAGSGKPEKAKKSDAKKGKAKKEAPATGGILGRYQEQKESELS